MVYIFLFPSLLSSQLVFGYTHVQIVSPVIWFTSVVKVLTNLKYTSKELNLSAITITIGTGVL